MYTESRLLTKPQAIGRRAHSAGRRGLEFAEKITWDIWPSEKGDLTSGNAGWNGLNQQKCWLKYVEMVGFHETSSTHRELMDINGFQMVSSNKNHTSLVSKEINRLCGSPSP